MAERKAVNKYYPPEWTPQKGSINKFRGTHALRERARKMHMGILIIRFEMPYNIWCDGCGNHIGMGVRYNAEKSKVGMYYTTPIYKFRMKCHLCPSHFEMQTDPQNLDYTILNGARRQERRWDPDENDQVAPEDKDVSKKMATDAMFKLEHGVEDKFKQKKTTPALIKLETLQEKWKDDYAQNQMLRKNFRQKKKHITSQEEKDKSLLIKASLNIPLLPESEADTKLAGLLRLAPVDSFEEKQLKKRIEIDSRPIFDKPNGAFSPSCNGSSTSNSGLIRVRSDAKDRLALLVTQQKIQDTAKIKCLDAGELGIINIRRKSQENGVKSDAKISADGCEDANLNSSLVSASYDSDSSS